MPSLDDDGHAFLVLLLVKPVARHSYAIMRAVEALSGGSGKPGPGALYGASNFQAEQGHGSTAISRLAAKQRDIRASRGRAVYFTSKGSEYTSPMVRCWT